MEDEPVALAFQQARGFEHLLRVFPWIQTRLFGFESIKATIKKQLLNNHQRSPFQLLKSQYG